MRDMAGNTLHEPPQETKAWAGRIRRYKDAGFRIDIRLKFLLGSALAQ